MEGKRGERNKNGSREVLKDSTRNPNIISGSFVWAVVDPFCHRASVIAAFDEWFRTRTELLTASKKKKRLNWSTEEKKLKVHDKTATNAECWVAAGCCVKIEYILDVAVHIRRGLFSFSLILCLPVFCVLSFRTLFYQVDKYFILCIFAEEV